MKGRGYTVIAIMDLLLLSGCYSIPSGTSNGIAIDLFIRESLFPVDVHVNVEDEVRWINSSSGSIRIVFPAYIMNRISCRRHFSGWFSGGTETTLRPGESASLCFSRSTYSTYLIRLTGSEGIEENTTGTIHVGGPSAGPPPQDMPPIMDHEAQP